MIMIDKLAYSSKLRYKSPCLKTFVAISSLFICVGARSIFTSIIISLVMGSLTIIKGKTPLKYYLKLMIIPLSFLILSTIAIIINISDEPLSLFSINVFSKYITCSREGMSYGFNLMMVSIGAISCLYFLSLSTPIIDLLQVLKVIRCPALLIELLLLIYRFIFVLFHMSNAISISQKCRLGNKNFKTSLKSSSNLLAVVFIRALKKSSILYDAMEARCYDGNLKVLKQEIKAGKKEIFIAVGVEIILLIVAVISWRY